MFASLKSLKPPPASSSLLVAVVVDADAAAGFAIESSPGWRISTVLPVGGAEPGSFQRRLAHLDRSTLGDRLLLRPEGEDPACVRGVWGWSGGGAGLLAGDTEAEDRWTRGWHDVEHDGSQSWHWTDGREASGTLPPVAAGSYDVVVQAGSHSTHARPQGLALAIEGRWLPELEVFLGPREYSWPVVVHRSGEVSFALRTRWASRPAGSADSRVLGVSVHSVMLVPRSGPQR